MDLYENNLISFDQEKTLLLAEKYKEILDILGENSDREGLLKTPQRVAKAMQFFMQGYEQDPEHILRSAMFTEDYRQMVIVKDIDFYSLCEHHLLPFFGKAHVAYIPNKKITGLSKIARVVEVFARRDVQNFSERSSLPPCPKLCTPRVHSKRP